MSVVYTCGEGYRAFGSMDNSVKNATMKCLGNNMWEWKGGLCESKYKFHQRGIYILICYFRRTTLISLFFFVEIIQALNCCNFP